MGKTASSISPLIDVTRAAVSVDYVHHEIHEGAVFSLSESISIPANSTIYMQMKTGAKSVHFRKVLTNASTNNMLWTVYEAPTVTDGTTLQPA